MGTRCVAWPAAPSQTQACPDSPGSHQVEVVTAGEAVEAGSFGQHGLLEQLVGRELFVRAEVEVTRLVMATCYPRREHRTATGSPGRAPAVLDQQELGEHPADHDAGGDGGDERKLEPSADRPARPAPRAPPKTI